MPSIFDFLPLPVGLPEKIPGTQAYRGQQAQLGQQEAAATLAQNHAKQNTDFLNFVQSMPPEERMKWYNPEAWAQVGAGEHARALSQQVQALLPGEVAQQGAAKAQTEAQTRNVGAEAATREAELPFVAPRAEAGIKYTSAETAGREAATAEQLRATESAKKTGPALEGIGMGPNMDVAGVKERMKQMGLTERGQNIGANDSFLGHLANMIMMGGGYAKDFAKAAAAGVGGAPGEVAKQYTTNVDAEVQAKRQNEAKALWSVMQQSPKNAALIRASRPDLEPTFKEFEAQSLKSPQSGTMPTTQKEAPYQTPQDLVKEWYQPKPSTPTSQIKPWNTNIQPGPSYISSQQPSMLEILGDPYMIRSIRQRAKAGDAAAQATMEQLRQTLQQLQKGGK